jgi:hypothetical protein
MVDLTVLGSVLQAIGVLYWLLAFGALGLVLWKVKGRRGRVLSVLAVVVLFGWMPAKQAYEAQKRQNYSREAWAYFKKLCDEKAGEKIYKTYTGVKSVLVVKPLPPAKDMDHFDQFWYGDPYSASATGGRAMSAASILTLYSRRPTGRQTGFEFVEMKSELDGVTQYQRITRPVSNSEMAKVESIERPVSRFAIAWEDISTPDDRAYWVAGSRLSVLDLSDDSIVAERIGYFIEAGFGSRAGGRRPWLTSRGPNTTCPPLLGGDYSDQWFLTSVFRQNGEK